MYPSGILFASGNVSAMNRGFCHQFGNNNSMKNKIAEFRKESGMSQEELGKRIGIQRSGMQKIEKKKIEEITVGQLLSIAKALNKNPIEIIDTTIARLPGMAVAEPDIMREASQAISSAAKELNIKLTLPEAMAYTVKLYNYVMKYMKNGKPIAPTEAVAELILQQAS